MMPSPGCNERNKSELFVTCSDQCDRNERNTPLGGVTVVTLATPKDPLQIGMEFACFSTAGELWRTHHPLLRHE